MFTMPEDFHFPETTFCRCCGTDMQHTDHCPECGCEEFEERCFKTAPPFCRTCGGADPQSEFHTH